MKRVIIIHAWDSSPEQHWYREEEAILQKLGFEVSVPVLPGGNWPKLDEWLSVIESLKPDKNTILIGHSLGVPAIFRYLDESGQKVDKVISVAGFVRDLGIEETRNFVDKLFDWGKIRSLIGKTVVIAQKEDPYISVEVAVEVADKTGGTWILVDGNNHFDTMDLDLINARLV